jgi:hypothetical protein
VSSFPIAGEEPAQTDYELVQLQRKVEQLRRVEPILKDLYQELFDQGLKDEAEAVIVALVRLQVMLAGEKHRLDVARYPSRPAPGRTTGAPGVPADRPVRGPAPNKRLPAAPPVTRGLAQPQAAGTPMPRAPWSWPQCEFCESRGLRRLNR